ncbi:hypothetical protein ACIBG7_03405 [Nonomuraea sp. NPDC050328]|uniref:hypothetical protein n=1 Tax=Nonomuraea sp. NPDC050328 TaxID=3364361 RepID=UPI00379634B8
MRRWLLVLLLAAGCGQADKPYTPRQAAAPPAASEEAGSTPTPTVETVRLGPELSVGIDWPADADLALLKGFTDLYLDSWRAVQTGDDGYLDRVEGAAAAEAHAWVRGFRGAKVRGQARLYALNVRAVVGDGAEVGACVDESGLRLLSRTGRELARQPAWTRGPYLQAVVLRRDDDGGWRVKDFRHDLKGCA